MNFWHPIEKSKISLPIESVEKLPAQSDQSVLSLNVVINTYVSSRAEIVFDLNFKKDQNFAEILHQALDDRKIKLETKDFGGGMGEFITSIDGATNTKDKWWQYWINGKYAKIGISNYLPKDKDRVSLKLIEYQNSYED